jgi:hypothetical protein
MRRKYWLVIVLAALLFPENAEGQGYWRLIRWEVGVGLGSIHPYTDIGPAQNELTNFFNGVRPNLDLSFGYKLNPLFAVCLNGGYVMIGGTDVDDDSHLRPDFNWQYTTHAFEHTIRFEYYPFRHWQKRYSSAMYTRRGMVKHFDTWDLYIFAGAGGLLSKAKVYEEGNPSNEITGWNGYNNHLMWNPVFPGGLGIKYTWSSDLIFSAELAGRYTLFDFLDGYSDPYWGDYNDYYYMFNLRVIYKLYTKRNGLPTFVKRYWR